MTPAVAAAETTDEKLARLMSDRVHYACGQNVLDGWLNVDGFDESYPNGYVDLQKRARIFRMDITAPHHKHRHQMLKQETRPNQADLNLVVELTK